MNDKIIAIDVATSGFDFSEDPSINHQIVSIGLVISDSDFNEVDSLYCEIKWDGTSYWNPYAEKAHGLTKKYLDENGLDEGDAVLQIAEFILKNYEPDEPIIFLGYSVQTFDVPFFNKLMRKYDLNFRNHYRSIDTYSIGYTLLGINTSDQLFDAFFGKRDKTCSLTEARLSLKTCKKVASIMGSI